MGNSASAPNNAAPAHPAGTPQHPGYTPAGYHVTTEIRENEETGKAEEVITLAMDNEKEEAWHIRAHEIAEGSVKKGGSPYILLGTGAITLFGVLALFKMGAPRGSVSRRMTMRPSKPELGL